MTLDGRQLEASIRSAVMEAVSQSLEGISERAKERAPVRRLYKSTARKRSIKGPIGVSAVRLNTSRGPAFAYASRYSSRLHRSTDFAHELTTTPGRNDKHNLQRSRPNSYEAEAQLKGGKRVSSSALRELRGRTLTIQSINHRGTIHQLGGLVLGSAARDIARGRGIVKGKGSKNEFGGTLRNSIKVEGPMEGTSEVFGYVSALAIAEGAKKPFNYAWAQEMGTAHNRPQPFLRPALREENEHIKSEMGRAAKSGFRLGFSHGAAVSGRSPGKKDSTLKIVMNFNSVARLVGRQSAGDGGQ